jgi:hypothetical protein
VSTRENEDDGPAGLMGAGLHGKDWSATRSPLQRRRAHILAGLFRERDCAAEEKDAKFENWLRLRAESRRVRRSLSPEEALERAALLWR